MYVAINANTENLGASSVNVLRIAAANVGVF